jgi:hypothetical protein
MRHEDGNGIRGVIFDFSPDQMISRVRNVGDFVGALVFQKWTGNSDSRQAIFRRATRASGFPAGGGAPSDSLVALMIDHGVRFQWTPVGVHHVSDQGLLQPQAGVQRH